MILLAKLQYAMNHFGWNAVYAYLLAPWKKCNSCTHFGSERTCNIKKLKQFAVTSNVHVAKSIKFITKKKDQNYLKGQNQWKKPHLSKLKALSKPSPLALSISSNTSRSYAWNFRHWLFFLLAFSFFQKPFQCFNLGFYAIINQMNIQSKKAL